MGSRMFLCGSGHRHELEAEMRACDHYLSHLEGELYDYGFSWSPPEPASEVK